MAIFRVRSGKQLPHGGDVLEAGAIVELPRHVAADTVVRDLIEEVDEAGNPVLAPLTNEFERFKPHEQVTLLTARLEEARARVTLLESQLAQAEAAAAPPAAPSVSASRGAEDQE